MTIPDPAETDDGWMRAALTLAQRGLGRVAPNPAVGCVLVRNGRVVGRGWTQPGGRPHAEAEALRRAGGAASGATAYVTLEPCSHAGETPPCADALVDAGIARCVFAAHDPDPRVAGTGMARLRTAGIAVTDGVLTDEALALNAGFVRQRREGRPEVTLKLATTLDGRIATATGESQWITGPDARRRAHLMRARHDAVMIGSGTAVTDDPRLTVRLDGAGACSPARVVVDSRLQLPLTHALVREAAHHPTLVLSRWDAPADRTAALNDAGVTVVPLPVDHADRVSLTAGIAALGSQGFTRVLVEGGSGLAASLLSADLVDRVAWFTAARVIGGDGRPALAGLGLARLADAPAFRRTGWEQVGADTLETLTRERTG